MSFAGIIRGTISNSVYSLEQDQQGQKEHKSEDGAKTPISYGKSALVLAFVCFSFVLLKNAWLSDDGYITLRTVSNFIHGYGLTWNIDERVQVYTHPLWMFLLSGAYFCVRSIYFSSILLSLGISAIAVAIFAIRIARSSLVAVVGLAILTASKSFIDFSTSGLENPLTHLLVVLFALVFFQCQQSKRYLFWLSLLGSMMILNRMDTVLLFLPALVYAWYRSPQSKIKALRTVVLAFLPFIVWELFSLFYYGFLFPNTAYAKLDTGIASSQLIKQGIAYLISCSTFDPLLFLVIVSAMILVIVQREWKGLLILLGMVLYMTYVVKVGGDFMAGRFLTPPFLMAVILLVRNIPSSEKLLWGGIATIVIVLGFLVPNSRWYVINPDVQLVDARGVADEHFYYAYATGLINFRRDISMPSSYLSQIGLQAKQKGQKVLPFNAIGYVGYEAGPYVHVLDAMGLSDPLIARLPIPPGEDWRIGHFTRSIPAGYMKTLETGTNMIQDPDLAQYYTYLHDVTSGPLFSGQRLIEIWNFNTGVYNGLLNHYIHASSAQSRMPLKPTPAIPEFFDSALSQARCASRGK